MEKCSRCKTIIREEKFLYCPCCGEPISLVDIILPHSIYPGVHFPAEVYVRGRRQITLIGVHLNDKPVWKGEKIVSGNSSYCLSLAAPKDLMSDEYQIGFKFSKGLTITKSIMLRSISEIELEIQSIQSIRYDDSNSSDIYISVCHKDVRIRAKNLEVEDLDLSFYCNNKTKDAKKAKKEDNRYIWKLDELYDLFGIKGEWNKITYEAILEVNSKNIDRLKWYVKVHFVKLPELSVDDVVLSRNVKIVPSRTSQFDLIINQTINKSSKFNPQGSDLHSIRVFSRSSLFLVKNRSTVFFRQDKVHIPIEYRPLDSECEVIDDNKIEFPFSIDVRLNDSLTEELKYNHTGYIPVIYQDRIIPQGFAVIDFGTSNTCWLLDNGELENQNYTEEKSTIQFIEFNLTDLLKTEVYIRMDTDLTPIANQLNKVANIKSMLPHNIELLYHDKCNQAIHLSATQLTMMYLNKINSEILLKHKQIPKEVVLTYPAIYTEEIRQRYFRIAEKIGLELNHLFLITEPEAIAYYYIHFNKMIRDKAKESKIVLAVFDCGGGTSDFTIVEYSKIDGIDSFKVLATWGTNQFSGLYITFLVGKSLRWENKEYPECFDNVLSKSDDARKFQDYYSSLENEKRKISEKLEELRDVNDTKTMSDIIKNTVKSIDSIDYFKRLTETQSSSKEPTIQGQFEKIRFVVKRLFDINQIERAEIDFLVLAGNGCRFPLIRLIAEREFPGKIIYEPDNLKKSVACGAYLYRYSAAQNVSIKGLKRSLASYHIYKGLAECEEVFAPLLDMTEEHIWASDKYRELPFEITLFIKESLFDEDSSRLKKAFTVPLTEVKNQDTYQYELKYTEFKIFYRWIYEKGGFEKEEEWRFIC